MFMVLAGGIEVELELKFVRSSERNKKLRNSEAVSMERFSPVKKVTGNF